MLKKQTLISSKKARETCRYNIDAGKSRKTLCGISLRRFRLRTVLACIGVTYFMNISAENEFLRKTVLTFIRGPDGFDRFMKKMPKIL